MTTLLGPSGVPQAVTISIITGNINANADEQRAPSNEMNAFNTGTTSANESAKLKKKQWIFGSNNSSVTNEIMEPQEKEEVEKLCQRNNKSQ